MKARALPRILLVLGWLAAGTFVIFAISARSPVPYKDDWDWLAWFAGEPSLGRLFAPHVQHVIPLARALLWIQFALEGANGQLIFWIALAAQVGVVGLFWREIAGRWPSDRRWRHAALGASFVTLFFAWQLQSVVFVASVLFPLVQLFAVFAFSHAAAASPPSVRPERSSFIVSVFASVAAMLSTTTGIAVPAIVALMAVLRRRRSWPVVAAHAALTLAGVATFAIVVLGTQDIRSTALSDPAPWLTVVPYFFAFFAPFLTFGNGLVGATAGLVLVVAGLSVIGTILREGDRATRIERFAVAVMVFAMISAALAAVARAEEYGVVQARQSRYATITVTYWAALILGAMSLIERRAASAIVVALGRLATMFALPAALALFGIHLISGVVFIAKANNVAVAGLALKSAARDDEWVRTLHHETDRVYAVVAQTRSLGDDSIVSADIGRHIDIALDMGTCRATLALTRAREGSALRMRGSVDDDVDEGWILDATGAVRGLAARAPLVDALGPSPGEVVAVVRTAIFARAWPAKNRWLGFASADAPGPYRFVGLADRTPRCATSLVLAD